MAVAVLALAGSGGERHGVGVGQFRRRRRALLVALPAARQRLVDGGNVGVDALPQPLAGGCVCVVNATDCSALQQQTGHQTQWVFWGGGKENCLILIDGQWVPTSSWIVNSGN